MSHLVPAKKVVCNTIIKDNHIKSRAWCFTLNNFMESETIKLQDDKYQYLFQEEIGENGTPHLQGVIRFKEPVRFTAVKKINGRAHWEKCKNWIASLKYCSKKETATGKRYTNIEKYLSHVPDVPKDFMPKRNKELEEILFRQELEEIMEESIESADLSQFSIPECAFDEMTQYNLGDLLPLPLLTRPI